MIFDCNAWLGHWPFRFLRNNTPAGLLALMDECGIARATVSSLDAILHRNAQPANEKLAEDIAPYAGRLYPLAAINPTYVKWEDDLRDCQEKMGMKGVRLCPQYHGYELGGPLGRQVAEACRERGLPVFVPHRIEDVRQRHSLDPGKTVEYEDMARLVAAVPGVSIVLTNARGDLAHSRLLQGELAERAWFVDLSLAEDVRRWADASVKTKGNHLLFGTHAPLTYPTCALLKLALLELDQEQLAKVQSGNAMKLLGLDQC